MKYRPTMAGLVAAACLAAAGCGGGQDSASAVADADTGAECLRVGQDLRDTIRAGLNDGATLEDAAAVRSPDHERVHYVAVRLGGPGLDGADAVWATTGDLDGSGLIVAADNMAADFGDYPAGWDTDMDVGPGDSGRRAALDCLDAS